MAILTVKDISEKEFSFVSDPQEVNYIKNDCKGLKDSPYDSFFVKIEDGEYKEIYGMEGIIPYLSKTVTKVY